MSLEADSPAPVQLSDDSGPGPQLDNNLTRDPLPEPTK